MPAAFDACVRGGGRVRTKKMSGGKFMHVCFKGGKSFAGEVHKKNESCGFEHNDVIQENLEWVSPILTEDYKLEEGIVDQDKIKIRGTAIKATESRNGIVYEFTELDKAAPSLLGKSIAINHSENVEDVVGEVTKIIKTGDGLDYEGIAFNTGVHPHTIDLLRKGIIKSMSIVATTPKEILNKEGKRVAKDIEFLGLDFVRFPGIREASVSIGEALEKNYIDGDISPQNQKGENMEEETNNKVSENYGHVLEKLVDKIDETAKLREEMESLRNEIKTLKEAPATKGNMVDEAEKYPFVFTESTHSKDIARTAKNAFVKTKNNSGMEVFAAHPEEFY